MKGILLAGGKGNRLWPLTNSINKHFLPIFDKPMIHYSLSTLMLAGINQILIISSYQNLKLFQQHFGNGNSLGLTLEYREQKAPIGIPNGISIAKDFIKKDNFALMLGDNIFHGVGLGKSLRQFQDTSGAKIFCANVSSPQDFGVVEILNNKIVSLVEKPISPRSKLAITGLYFFDSKAINLVSELQLSARGEYEIVDLLKLYLDINELEYEILPRGTAWLDTGTPIGILEASQYVETIQKRQGLQIGCLEEIAWRNQWISDQELLNLARQIPNSNYAKYLYELVDQS
jgi:glucose-1-phosphate thymidylyltransferase